MTIWLLHDRLRPLLRRQLRPQLLPFIWLVLALILGVTIAVQSGAVTVTAADWLAQSDSAGAFVLWQIRLPRALFSILVGASLGLAGALTQGLFRNPLADPGLLGINAGAACAAALTIVVISRLHFDILHAMGLWLLPVAAFSGALAVCFILDRIARWITPGSIAGLLLSGVALNALAASVIGLCTYLANDEQLRSLSFWTLGSLAGGSWLLVGILTFLLLVAGFWLRPMLRVLNALALGETAATQVGVDVSRLRQFIIFMVAVLAGFSVAWCGMIGFIGLIAPHLVRLWAGADQRQVIPLSMLMGGLVLLVADTMARTVAIPAEIPVGIFTALIGSPLFLLLLRGYQGRMG